MISFVKPKKKGECRRKNCLKLSFKQIKTGKSTKNTKAKLKVPNKNKKFLPSGNTKIGIIGIQTRILFCKAKEVS